MPATRRVPKCSGTSEPEPEPEPEQYLPVDLLLEIVVRSNVTTVVRCTAASRVLRRAIVDPAFRRRLAAADGVGFEPALLLGVSYRAWIWDINLKKCAHRVIHTPPSAKPGVLLDDPSQRGSFEPVASGDGLLLLRRYDLGTHVQLRVRDILTGQATSLPQIGLSSTYGHVFLSAGDTAESYDYELVVVDIGMLLQTFSSNHGRWGPVRQVSITEHQTETHRYRLGGACPAVVGRTVYWPYRRDDNGVCWDLILAMDVNTATGTIIELPPGRMMARDKDHLLLASVCGFLSLLVVESGGISMWTLTTASSTAAAMWSRQLVIGKVEMEKVVGFRHRYDCLHFALEGFGPRSGAVIVRVGNGQLLRLDLGTKLVKRLLNQGHYVSVIRLFLHETYLVSILQAMKCF